MEEVTRKRTLEETALKQEENPAKKVKDDEGNEVPVVAKEVTKDDTETKDGEKQDDEKVEEKGEKKETEAGKDKEAEENKVVETEIKTAKDNGESKTDKEEDISKKSPGTETETPKKEEKPKFVFGQNSKFSESPFSKMGKKNVFDSGKSATSSGFVFGSSSKFSNAFSKSSSSKPSIFDQKPSSDDAEKNTPEKSEEKPQDSKQVVLQKQDVKSGEEEETSVIQIKAKVYILRLKDLKTGWKENGVGMLHVNKPKNETAKARIVMRTIGALKLVLNVPIIKDFELFKGMESSLQSNKFIRFNHALSKDDLVQYAVKVGNPDAAEELYESIKKLIPK